MNNLGGDFVWIEAGGRSVSGVRTGTHGSMQAIAVSALFSIAVGIFFGYYPARKASLLDPIEALRYVMVLRTTSEP